MSDYDKLVESLRSYSIEVISYKIDGAFAYEVAAAADAIEQLVKERDALMRDLKAYGNACYICRDHDLCYSALRGVNTKCDTIDNEYWEWRGVQEDNDERTE